MNQSIIRRAIPSDAPAINDLCLQAYQEFESVIGSSNWQQLRETLARAAELSNRGEIILAENAEGLAGMVVYVAPGAPARGKLPATWASLSALAVSPRCRGLGIGRKLTEECIERARRDGAIAIRLTTSEMMTVAQPMYLRMGFQLDADLGLRFGVNEVRYVLRLS
jgi:ribosomal protein S18 acetylase RimI-like enzyme